MICDLFEKKNVLFCFKLQLHPKVQMNQPTVYEVFTTRDATGRRIVRSRAGPVDDPAFSTMMQVPNRQAGPEVNLPGQDIFQRLINTLAMSIGQNNNDFEVAGRAGANGPGNTAPPPRDPLANPAEALGCVIDTVMEIYPHLGEGNNAQNLTQEQNDVIMSALATAKLPASRRLRNLVLREIILRTRVKTTVSEDVLNELDTMEYAQLDPSIQTKLEKCTICLCEFEDTDTVRLLKCNHFFHQGCIDPYLKNYNNKCPMCRDEN